MDQEKEGKVNTFYRFWLLCPWLKPTNICLNFHYRINFDFSLLFPLLAHFHLYSHTVFSAFYFLLTDSSPTSIPTMVSQLDFLPSILPILLIFNPPSTSTFPLFSPVGRNASRSAPEVLADVFA